MVINCVPVNLQLLWEVHTGILMINIANLLLILVLLQGNFIKLSLEQYTQTLDFSIHTLLSANKVHSYVTIRPFR